MKLKKEIKDLFSLKQKEQESLKIYLSRFMAVATDIEPLNQVEAIQAFCNIISNWEVGVELTKNPISTLGDLQCIVNRYVQVEELVIPWNNKFSKKGIDKRKSGSSTFENKKFKPTQPTDKLDLVCFTPLTTLEGRY